VAKLAETDRAVVVLADLRSFREGDRNDEWQRMRLELVDPPVLLTAADHPAAQSELLREPDHPQGVEQVAGLEDDRHLAVGDRLESGERGVVPRPRLGGVRLVRRLSLAMPSGVEQRLSEERHGTHQGSGVAVGTLHGVHRCRLDRVRAHDVESRVVSEVGDGAATAEQTGARNDQRGGESGSAQRLPALLVAQPIEHRALGPDDAIRMSGLGQLAGFLERPLARHPGVDQSGVDGLAVEWPEASVGRRFDRGADGLDDAVPDDDRGVRQHTAGSHDDASTRQGVDIGRLGAEGDRREDNRRKGDHRRSGFHRSRASLLPESYRGHRPASGASNATTC
jgi:hypothetical protein